MVVRRSVVLGKREVGLVMVRTVSMMPFRALDRIWSMLNANVRKVDWVLLVVTRG